MLPIPLLLLDVIVKEESAYPLNLNDLTPRNHSAASGVVGMTADTPVQVIPLRFLSVNPYVFALVPSLDPSKFIV
jgi:hypothetical protein